MRTVSAAELSRLASNRAAVVKMPLPPAPPPMAVVPPAPPPVAPNNDRLADAVLQLGTLLAGALQSMRPPEPPPVVAPMVAPVMVARPQSADAEPVKTFEVATTADGLMLSVSAGDLVFTPQRDEDGSAESIEVSGPGGPRAYRIVRGLRDRITSVELIG